jgi:glucokinase
MIVLAGDVGGTNIRLALFSDETGLQASIREAVFSSKRFSSLKGALFEFLADTEFEPQAAAFVIAGPVLGDEVEITNLDWVAKKSDVSSVLGDIPIAFYNDLAGISNFLPVISDQDLIVLNSGERVENKTKAVLAPGTGLGEGFLIWDGSTYRVQSSEGGHATFGPENEIQTELLEFMRQRYGHVSYERVCSGLAIPDLYEFVKERENWVEPEWFRQKLAGAADKTPLIVQAAFDPQQPLEACGQVIRLFVDMLASEAGNLALKVLALGGVYLAGGVTLRILPVLEENFVGSFTSKGRFSEFLESVPVYVVTHPQPALFGAARFAFQLAGVQR